MATTGPDRDTGEVPIHIGETQAKGARSVGLIWVLVISLAAAVLLLVVVLAWYASALDKADRRGGPGSIPKAAAAQFHTPAPPPATQP